MLIIPAIHLLIQRVMLVGVTISG